MLIVIKKKKKKAKEKQGWRTHCSSGAPEGTRALGWRIVGERESVSSLDNGGNREGPLEQNAEAQ